MKAKANLRRSQPADSSGWLDWLQQRKPVATIGSGVHLFHVTDAR